MATKKPRSLFESWSVSDVRKPSGHGLSLLQIIAVGYAFLSPATKRGLDYATGMSWRTQHLRVGVFPRHIRGQLIAECACLPCASIDIQNNLVF